MSDKRPSKKSKSKSSRKPKNKKINHEKKAAKAKSKKKKEIKPSSVKKTINHEKKATKAKSKKKKDIKSSSVKKTSRSKNKFKQKRKKKIIVLSSAAVLFALIISGSIWGYTAYKNNLLSQYKKSVYEIEVRTDENLKMLIGLYENLIPASSISMDLLKKFENGEDALKRGAEALKTLTPPEIFKAKHKTKISLYTDSSALYLELHGLASHIKSRKKMVDEHFKSLKNLVVAANEARRRSEIIEIALKEEKKIKETLTSIDKNKLEKTYDSKLILTYKKSLGEQLKELQKAILRRSRYKIRKVLLDIEIDFEENWKKSFEKADKRAIKEYAQKVKSLSFLHRENEFISL